MDHVRTEKHLDDVATYTSQAAALAREGTRLAHSPGSAATSLIAAAGVWAQLAQTAAVAAQAAVFLPATDTGKEQ